LFPKKSLLDIESIDYQRVYTNEEIVLVLSSRNPAQYNY